MGTVKGIQQWKKGEEVLPPSESHLVKQMKWNLSGMLHCHSEFPSSWLLDLKTYNAAIQQSNQKVKNKTKPFSPQLGLALHGLMWQLSDISCARRGAHHQASEGGQKSWTKEGISWGEVVERFQLAARFLQRIMHSKPIGISWPKLCWTDSLWKKNYLNLLSL